jgi:murein DD-endopeptidase MepM/ murein hydrolase activator NlpD
MWTASGRAAAVVLLALALASPAAAHTDDHQRLSLAWPAQGTVTSQFGYDGVRPHSGLDIGILRSPAITAAAPGRVSAVGVQPGYEGYGTVVLVNVGPPFATLYAHLSRTAVRVGELVTAGQRIGTAGCTGWCTGTHLHFELRNAGLAVDPSFLLP